MCRPEDPPFIKEAEVLWNPSTIQMRIQGVGFVVCRPEDPPFIKEAEVLWNPFDDIEPRTTRAERLAAAER